MPVILSAAKDLGGSLARSFAALRMTGWTPLKPAHGKPSLQMSNVHMALAKKDEQACLIIEGRLVHLFVYC